MIRVSSSPEHVEIYSPFILEIELPFLGGNPYDPDDVKVYLAVDAPGGKKFHVPMFCRESKKKRDLSRWEARFTPLETGKYRYHIHVESRLMTKSSPPAYFQSVAGGGDGFLRRSANNDLYLAFDSGKGFFGIGHNVGWSPGDSIKVFDRYFTLLEKNGCNMTRVWMCDWSFPIEWKKPGKYDQTASFSLDGLVELAAERNIYIMLCLDTYGSLMEEKGYWNEERWEANPYNARNGGPCERPEDFFTDPEARRLYKNKLRYILSRWGYSPNIMAFELWNEYNAPKEWVEEMSSYIKDNDTHGHLVTTSSGYPWGSIYDESDIWELSCIDIITLHLYGSKLVSDVVLAGIQKAHQFSSEYDKPFLMAEAGMDMGRDDKHYDEKGWGTALHNSIWSTALSGYMGTSMNWWWDTYIRPKKLYYHYRALEGFLRGVDWNSRTVEYIRTGPVRIELPARSRAAYGDVIFKPVDKWGEAQGDDFTVLSGGDVTGGIPAMYLHGDKSKKYRVEQKYRVNYPAGGEFIIQVGMVSHHGHLVVCLDGKTVIDRELTCGAGEGLWQRSMYRKDQKVYQCVYNTDIAIDVPAGEHVITLQNKGKDWISVKKIRLTNYQSSDTANARCLGLRVGGDMLFWVQNMDFNWKNYYSGEKAGPIRNAWFEASGVEDGAYEVMWWDTFRGREISRGDASAKRGVLRLDVPEFSADNACRVTKK